MKRPKISVAATLAVLVSVHFANVSRAAEITFDNQELRNSGETMLPLLTLDASPNEAGGAAWDGAADVLSGDWVSTTRTLPALNLTEAGILADGSNFGLLLEVDEPDAGLVLQDLTATFFEADGSVLFTASTAGSYALGSTLSPGNAGYIFRVELSGPEAAQFFGNSSNRVGVAAAITDSAGGPEIISAASLTDAQIIPLPAAAWLGIVGFSLILLARRALGLHTSGR